MSDPVPSVEWPASAPGFLACPDDGPSPGLVVVHDVWGLSEHTRSLARRFAAEGFATLAVDLYRTLPDRSIADPATWMRNLSDPDMLSEIRAAVDFLGQHDASRGRKLGVVGFCMGGLYAWLAAARVAGLSAAVPFYGLLSYDHGMMSDPRGRPRDKKPESPLEVAPAFACPVLAFFGAEDTIVPLSDVRELEAKMRSARCPTEIVVIEGAGHAFMNDTRPEMYRPEAAREAWERTIEFLRVRLE